MNDRKGLEPNEALYRSVFQHSAVSLWIQDITELRGMIRDWHKRGTHDIRSYLEEHRDELQRAVHSIRVLDVNDATLAMYEVEDKRVLLAPLDEVLDLNDPISAETITGDIVAIAENRETIDKETTTVSPSGKRLDVRIQIYIPPEDAPVPYMLVNVIEITKRRRLERELEKDRKLYHIVIDNLPDAVYLKDTNRRFLLANQAAAQLFEVEGPSRLIGRTVEELLPAETARLFTSGEESLLRTGEKSAAEEAVTTSTGSRLWVLSTKVAVRDASGDIIGLVGITKDVTELRAIERALRDSEHRYRTLFERAPLGISHSTADGKLIDANPALAKSLGFESPEELMEFVDANGLDATYADPKMRQLFIDSASEQNDWSTLKWIFRRRDGSIGLGRELVRSYHQDDSDELRFEAFTEDVTEQEGIQQRLAYERSLHTALMDNILDRIFFKDTQGHYTLVNRAQALAVGAGSPAALLGKSDIDFFPHEYAESTWAAEQKVLETGEPIIDAEEHIVRPDGSDTWLLTTRMLLRNPKGEVIGTFGVSRDVTARRELQARLIRSERLESLSQLAAGIAHQFNNINTAVLSRVEAALLHPELPEVIRTHLQNIRFGVRRSADITGRIEVLTLGSEAQAETVLLGDLLGKIFRPLRTSLSHDGITLHTRLRTTPPIRASESIVQYIVGSIVSNSIDALIRRPNPAISATTIVRRNFAGFVVEDNGLGIPERTLPKLFTPFFTTKGEWARSRSNESAASGIGLSLAVARSLVSELGGSIEVHSNEGAGTSLTVLFPIADSPFE